MGVTTFKETVVGAIPNDWEVRPLKDISPRQSVGLVINPSTYFDKRGTVPLLVGSHVREGSIDAGGADRITEASNGFLTASRLSAGDLVTIRVGEPGLTAVVPPELDGCNCASLMITRGHSSFDSRWLCAAMNSAVGRRQVERVQYGTAQKVVNIGEAIGFLFAVPPLREQKAIAEVLGDVDALLEGLDRQIAKKRDLKQATMQQLLTGGARLPGFKGEWPTRRIGEFADCRTGGTPSTGVARFWGGPLRWMSSGELHQKRVHEVNGRITQAGLDSCNATILPEKCVLIGLAGQGRTRGTVALNMVSLCTNQSIGAVLPSRDHNSEFLYYNLDLRYEELRELSSGDGGRGGLNLAILRSLQVALPAASEQKGIATVLSDMDAELAALEARREKTRLLKQGMMQELLTGRIRLV